MPLDEPASAWICLLARHRRQPVVADPLSRDGNAFDIVLTSESLAEVALDVLARRVEVSDVKDDVRSSSSMSSSNGVVGT